MQTSYFLKETQCSSGPSDDAQVLQTLAPGGEGGRPTFSPAGSSVQVFGLRHWAQQGAVSHFGSLSWSLHRAPGLRASCWEPVLSLSSWKDAGWLH